MSKVKISIYALFKDAIDIDAFIQKLSRDYLKLGITLSCSNYTPKVYRTPDSLLDKLSVNDTNSLWCDKIVYILEFSDNYIHLDLLSCDLNATILSIKEEFISIDSISEN